MNHPTNVNVSAREAFEKCSEMRSRLRIEAVQGRANVLDFGVNTQGGLAAGLGLARICMAGLADVQLASADHELWQGPFIRTVTDWPLEACMLGQYAGWPVKGDDYFAMGSGPMRVKRGKEELLEHIGAADDSPVAVGTLESSSLPPQSVLDDMASQCGVPIENLYVAVAPTSSIAGCVQVVARSVETAMHRLHSLDFPLESVLSGIGLAPIPPATPDFALGIGRTNDAILYGGSVTLWVDGEDDQLAEVAKKLPSCSSRDYGRPFADTFKAVGYDFYKVDPNLFSPAEVLLINSKTGNSFRGGRLRFDLINSSFGTQK